MAKLYFKYGVMGSSKTAQALITKFNYEKKGNKVLFLKPGTDTRDGETLVKSRVGLEAEAVILRQDEELAIKDIADYSVIICDESQFFTPKQIQQFKDIAEECNIPVVCYGLLTDFKTNLFPGSKRLVELADSLQEIKTVCGCGRKATINARIIDGKVVKEGAQVMLGGDESYEAMCYGCWNGVLI